MVLKINAKFCLIFSISTSYSLIHLPLIQAAIDATKLALPDFSHALLSQCEELVVQINASARALSEAMEGRVIGMSFDNRTSIACQRITCPSVSIRLGTFFSEFWHCLFVFFHYGANIMCISHSHYFLNLSSCHESFILRPGPLETAVAAAAPFAPTATIADALRYVSDEATISINQK